MPTDPRLKAQVDLILESHPDAAAFPANWDAVGDVDYLYRKGEILAREQDETRVMQALERLLREEGEQASEHREEGGQGSEHREEGGQGSEHRMGADTRRIGGVVAIPVPTPPPGKPQSIPEILDALDGDPQLGPGRVTPNHMAYVCPHPCPATEPGEVPLGTATPFPPPGMAARCGCPGHGGGCDGEGVFVSVLDTGWEPDAATKHPWLAGVDGTQEDTFEAGTGNIRPYAGHGTFVAGCLRCVAPKASVFVERAFDVAAAKFETDLVPVFEHALSLDPDIFLFTFTASCRHNRSLLTFDDFYERRIRHVKGPVVVAPAGNDHSHRMMYPAAFDGVVSVGALSASWQDRAHFSNHGGWVDVYAPGEDLINAFPTGTFICHEPPVGQARHFQGMARWSGTSFSTPIVAGLIAARMSATGESGRQAAQSLLRLARSQAIAGVGAVLYPGQACCDHGHGSRHHRCHDAGWERPRHGCAECG
jgi:Subtilase family